MDHRKQPPIKAEDWTGLAGQGRGRFNERRKEENRYEFSRPKMSWNLVHGRARPPSSPSSPFVGSPAALSTQSIPRAMDKARKEEEK